MHTIEYDGAAPAPWKITTDDGGRHEITPVKGSARRVRDGEQADLTMPTHYPVEAVCLGCGRPIRIERYYFSEWIHVECFTKPGRLGL